MGQFDAPLTPPPPHTHTHRQTEKTALKKSTLINRVNDFFEKVQSDLLH